MSDFQIAESKTFEKVKKKIDSQVYTKIKNIVYPQLKLNPYFGTNIKKLKGGFEGYYRYRVGSYRLFYLIDNEKIIVVIVDLKHRRNAYK
ncbi:MAG: type II toxin-antitoxin system RelE/ParE family toxin [Desulfobacula sp.]|uniref:type II toxin-antitoxin system RelE family toxin n=1 Tax=Desulfobacula sp. TaxID=2593537 RepID=UPI001D8C64CE|nr:type II toxin-antitoxin system RelE/ParE family toxin [Desulfobacula sp.]MBT3484614.1 type II toxin-antitoxin system RelE/ParE family toxin [Desulfobacula sp.]MBT3803984.1 type II toxin-antitoxin system RelE/ParE family toxin [Desulfobacula sp.]MBT4023599.1 type II toxin-antitoxin system RelE/ParE family toxin [Desulfobacula sp.]MBT4197733.1 type II toxin-antitoxin system RelE/ParE family toxin [Desulfobacula sp.]